VRPKVLPEFKKTLKVKKVEPFPPFKA